MDLDVFMLFFLLYKSHEECTPFEVLLRDAKLNKKTIAHIQASIVLFTSRERPQCRSDGGINKTKDT